MDSSNYEQEFINNIKQTGQPALSPHPAPKSTSNASVIQLTIIIILAIIVLIESVALAIFIVNYGEVLDLYGDYETEYNEETIDDSPEALSQSSSFSYDKKYNITAFNLVCTAEDDSKYTFSKSGEYQKSSSSSDSTESGIYSIINSGAVVLNNPNQTEDKIVYYDGYDIIEGVTFYTCKET